MIDLSEKVVLVTGASRGIGAASARVLATAGANVILHYGRSLGQAQTLADQIGPRASLVQADLSKPGAARGLWQQALAIHGRIDVLVNNAGILFDAPLEGDDETWARAWQEMLQVNLIAVADLCREAIASFPQNPGKTKGIIINISSRAGFMGSTAARMPYSASKAGVIALTRSIARSYAKTGVLAYALAPGFVQSDMADYSIEQYGLEKLLADNPMGEMAPPEDVAHTVAFLASGLVPHMTGATLDINGASYVR
jgi:3-oxoacyl-[acyl-carrier protein] reductase